MSARPFANIRERAIPMLKGAIGLLSVSRPGYDWNKGEAVVYITLECGSMCGHGAYLHLERSRGGWVVLRWQETWVG